MIKASSTGIATTELFYYQFGVSLMQHSIWKVALAPIHSAGQLDAGIMHKQLAWVLASEMHATFL